MVTYTDAATCSDGVTYWDEATYSGVVTYWGGVNDFVDASAIDRVPLPRPMGLSLWTVAVEKDHPVMAVDWSSQAMSC